MANNTLEMVLSLATQQFTTKLTQAANDVKSKIGEMAASARDGGSWISAGFDRAAAGAGNLKSTIAQLLGLIGGGMLFKKMGDEAVAFNSTLEFSQIGLAAIARTYLDLSGESDAYGRSMGIAKDIQKQLQIEGLKTVATYQQLLVALQEGIGPAFKKGFNPQQVVEFTSLMTQAAAAISLPMDQLGQEIRSILDGTIDRNSRVAKALGITNEKVQELAASGKLFDYLKGKLSEFGVAGQDMAKTWKGATSNLLDAVQMALGVSFENAFKGATKLILNLRDSLITVDEKAGTFKINEKIEAALNKAGAAVTSFLAKLTTADIDRYLTTIADTALAVIVVFGSMFGMLKSIADTMGESVPTIVKYTAEFVLFTGGLKIFTGTIGSVVSGITAINTAFGLMPTGLTGAVIGITSVSTAVTTLTGILTLTGGVLAALGVGWEVGTLLRKFDFVEKAGIKMAETYEMARLSIKHLWAEVTGGDTEGIKRQVKTAQETFAKMYEDLENRSKSAGKVQTDEQKKVADIMQRIAEQQKRNAEQEKNNTDVHAKAMTESEAMDKLKMRSTESIRLEVEKLQKAYEILKNSGMSQDDLAIAAKNLREETKKLNDELKITTKEEENAAKAATKKANAEALDAAKESYRKQMEAAKESADQQREAVTKAIDIIKAKYKQLGDEVSAILKSIADRQQSLTSEMSDMARGGMSSGDAWKDLKKEADAYYRSAQDAADAGDMEATVQFADKAREAYKQLNHEVKNGEQVIVSAQDALKASMAGTQKAGELGIDALQRQKDAKSQQMQAMDQETGGALSSIPTDDEKLRAAFDMIGTYSEQADKQFSILSDAFAQIWDEGAKKADESFGRISDGLKALTQKIKALQGEQADISAGEDQPGAAGTESADASAGPSFNWDLGGTIMKELDAKVGQAVQKAGEIGGNTAARPDTASSVPDKIVEIRWGDGSLQGSEASVEDFLRQIKQAGLLV
jgi:hypothetical protein